MADQTQEQRCSRVGLVYDERMCKHANPKNPNHPEKPERLPAVWNKLESAGIPQRCEVFKAKKAEDKHIHAVHSIFYTHIVKTISTKPSTQQLFAADIASGDRKYADDVFYNEGSSESAYLAAGSVLQVAEKVAKGELKSAFAIVRPPGHHAEEDRPRGFCFLNNVAIAAQFLLDQKELGINKILIVDWDVHHGNGTQKMFWKDPRVLFFSVHRYSKRGTFYPPGGDGSHLMIGEGPGLGYNINVPWEEMDDEYGDADYVAAWDHILIPVAKEFKPDIILISAGFDSAIDDPFGGCGVTPNGYAILLKKLIELSSGKIVMTLEGGYNLTSLANSVLACVELLLDEENPITESTDIYPFASTWPVIKAVRETLSKYWPVLADDKLPEKLPSRVAPEQIDSLEELRRIISGIQNLN